MLTHVWTAFTCGLFIGLFAGATVICILVAGRRDEDYFGED